MKEFLKSTNDTGACEMLVDARIYTKDEVLRSAYNFLDKGYFLFYTAENGDILVQCKSKDSDIISAEKLLLEFSDELTAVHLRFLLENENKTIRETIVGVALTSSLDTKNFIQTSQGPNNSEQYFDKDIHEILKEIQNDPTLNIDEHEIEDIFKEIEQERFMSPKIKIDTDAVKDVKAKFTKNV